MRLDFRSTKTVAIRSSVIAFLTLITAVSAAPTSHLVAPAPIPLNTLRVMTFNVMCDFCGKNRQTSTFDSRMAAAADTINRHSPDLISLQELRTGEQVEQLRALLREKYTAVYAQSVVMSYPDPTLLIRDSRFEVLSSDGFWLGPSAPNFSFGWKARFPRRVQFAELRDRSSDERVVFAGAHFDNNVLNREPSARMLGEKFSRGPLPFIFGGDTNLRPDRNGYATLASDFRDTFREVSSHSYVANGPTIPEDGCNLEKAPTFPECRVDHVLLSKTLPWKTKEWRVDTFRYGETQSFISDHRAIVVDLER